MFCLYLCALACVLVAVLGDVHGSISDSEDRFRRLERLAEKQSEEISLLKREINHLKGSQSQGLSNSKRLLMTVSPSTPNSKVAFYAYLTQAEMDPGHHHNIVFDHVQTNDGSAYNKHTGSFVAPEEGVYIFAYSVTGYAGSIMPVELVVNSNVVASTAADSRSSSIYPVSSNTVALHLNQGDNCYLRTTPNTSWGVGNIYSSAWSRSSFTGWKL